MEWKSRACGGHCEETFALHCRVLVDNDLWSLPRHVKIHATRKDPQPVVQLLSPQDTCDVFAQWFYLTFRRAVQRRRSEGQQGRRILVYKVQCGQPRIGCSDFVFGSCAVMPITYSTCIVVRARRRLCQPTCLFKVLGTQNPADLLTQVVNQDVTPLRPSCRHGPAGLQRRRVG